MKLILGTFYAIYILLNTISIGFLHPGRTDSGGGHHCYTNCSKWGYTQGEYHYHDSNTSNPKNPTSNIQIDNNDNSATDWLLWFIPLSGYLAWVIFYKKK
ncbi:MAG: hypothetical protein KGZ51_05865 [Erysipelothrix sp.]|jgi:hypothetical protein|nr:hypothetical protein [Erysipelothrix sp.]